ncbi:serine hydrolase [Bombilactobacillus folatiphilus]|uniref:Serine hydrolase n=1 Tax=Bombilactobacillus folatiphilus TaxID=2923362 RepID=A0ABY4P9I9_9LACO|nr:serine hydrolase [Bombilactobacillus folatiphilus]UQS82408.1 serine hydrolase [Bombilactobacillus folatiphilus]
MVSGCSVHWQVALAKHEIGEGNFAKATQLLKQSDARQAQKYLQQIVLLKQCQQQFNSQQWSQLQQTNYQLQQQQALPAIKQRAQRLVKISQQITPVKSRSQQATGVLSNQQFGTAITAGILIDQQTGQILWQKSAQVARPVASMSKLLAVLTIEQAIKKRHLNLQTPIVASDVIVGLDQKTGLTNAGLKIGQTYTMQQLLEATMVASANDAVMVLGQYLYGSQDRFVTKMLAQARQLKLSDCQIVNANGLPKTLDPMLNDNPQATVNENQLSAQDLAKITQKLLALNPNLLQITQQKQVQIDNRSLPNTNKMLPGTKFGSTVVSVDGFKTGTSTQAGACVTVTGKIYGRRVIFVLLHAPSDSARFLQARELLEKAAQSLTLKQVSVIHWQKAKTQAIWLTTSQAASLQMCYQAQVLTSKPRLTVQFQSQHQRLQFLA